MFRVKGCSEVLFVEVFLLVLYKGEKRKKEEEENTNDRSWRMIIEESAECFRLDIE